MSEQDKKNLDFAITQFGTADREYSFFFSGSGIVITVKDGPSLIAQVWGDCQKKVF